MTNMQQHEWDRYDATILLNYYLKCTRGELSEEDAIFIVSDELSKKAKESGFVNYNTTRAKIRYTRPIPGTFLKDQVQFQAPYIHQCFLRVSFTSFAARRILASIRPAMSIANDTPCTRAQSSRLSSSK